MTILSWTDLYFPFPAVIAVALLAFGSAWFLRRRAARRKLARKEHQWHEQLRLERLDAGQSRARVLQLVEEADASRAELAASQALSRRLGDELEAQVRALDAAKSQRDFLELDRSRLQANAARLLARVEELAPLAGLLELEQGARRAEATRAETLERDLDEAVARAISIAAERDGLRSEVEALDRRLEEAAAVAAGEFERHGRQVEAWQGERTRLRAELAQADARHREALAALSFVIAERDEGRVRLRDLELTHQAELLELRSTVGSLEAQVARLDPLRRQLEDREQLIRVLAVERDAKDAELAGQRAAADGEIARLRGRLAELEKLVAVVEAAERRSKELESRYSRVARERDQLAGTVQRYLAELETMKAEAKDREQRFRSLADEFRATRSARDQEIAGLKAHMEGLEAQLQDRTSPDPGLSTEWQPVDGSPPDDLKRIRGIGPTLEKVLHQEGIYLFRQIATWTPDDVARIAERLRAFPDRIHRDDWITRAREEHRRKYGVEP